MANHKSAIKRARQNTIRQIRNKSVKTRTKNVVKSVRLAADQNNFDLTVQRLDEAKSMLAKAAKKGVIHRNAASRKISRLSKLVNTLRA